MNDAQLDHAQKVLQLMSLAAICIPIATYAGYWVWMVRQDLPPSNGRNRYWYTAYAIVAIFLLMGALA